MVEILRSNQHIIRGDLNYNFFPSEIWGEKARKDPLPNFFKAFNEDHNMVDITTENGANLTKQ